MMFDIDFYWKLFWRRLPVMMLFILVCSTLGVITAMKLPETWRTSARLLVEAPQIPDQMVGTTIDINPIEQLDIIQQRLLTRANMIDIANRFDVYENIRQMNPDTVVSQMRRDSRVRRSNGRNQATLLTVSFDARDGQIAQDVVNQYVTLLLEANSDFRVGRAENTLAFFEQEVRRLSEDLDQQSAEIAIFRSENADALPEGQNFRLAQQSQAQERLRQLQRDLAAAQSQRTEIIRVFELTGGQNATVAPSFRSREEEQLLQAQGQLQDALSVYSETHPLVVRLKARVTQLEETVEEQRSNLVGGGAAEDAPQMTPQETLLQASLAEIDGRIAFLQLDIETAKEQLEQVQSAISRSGANGIEMAALQRDFENIQARYNSALNNLNRAQVGERIETTAQGQRITVIENASRPQTPAGPNRTRIAALGVAAGLGLAVGYFLLLEFLNRTVRRPAELIKRFNVQPIAVVPYMESRRHRLLRRGGILTATAVVLVVVPLGLWYIDTNYLPLEMVVQRGLNRLGLG